MAVVIRLQGLNVTAGSADIRRFFTGLRIPDGGVHIIGGELDEAFIIFASDEDARRAMTRSGGFINGAPVSLLLSSKQEMQSVLERTTQNVELDDTGRPEGNGRPARGSMDLELGRRSSSRSGYSPPSQHQRPASNDDPFVVFLNGLPFSVTETQIIEFFNGLVIDEIVLCKKLATGQNNGKGFVRFASKEDTLEALKRDRKYIGSRYVDVRSTTADCWLRAGGSMPGPVHTLENFERGRAPVRSQRYPDYQDRSRSPVVQGPTASKDEEYCVLLDNLSYAVEKEDVKHIFPGANLENDQILFLANEGRRTRSAFVLFKSMRDYSDALSQEKRLFRNRLIHVRAISRENMLRLLESSSDSAGLSGNSERFQGSPPSDPRDRYDSERVYAVVRNLPFDVRKVEIIDFFHGFNITEDRVRVLRDHKGDGIGQALVLFGSEAEATEALSLNGRRFLGSEVGVKCITHAQMEQLTAEEPAVEDVLPKVGLSSARSSETFYGPGADIRKPKDGNFPIKEERIHGGHDYEPRGVKPYSPRERGSGGHGRFGALDQRYDGPTCVQLVNLPFQIRSEEVYDFCYGYRVIPGSVSLQYEPNGRSKGSATLVFESRQEALNAIQELNGRPIGPRKIQLLLI